MMKRSALALIILSGISLLLSPSCSDRETGGGGGGEIPTPPEKPDHLKEVGQLLSFSGSLPKVEPGLRVFPAYSGSFDPFRTKLVEPIGIVSDGTNISSRIGFELSECPRDFATLEPWMTSLWPGCLVAGHSLQGTEAPKTVDLEGKRQSGRISLQIASGAKSIGPDGEGRWSEEVKDMQATAVQEAQRKLVGNWLISGAPSSTSYSMEIVNCAEEALALSGLDVKRSKEQVVNHLDKRFDYDEGSGHVLVKVYQHFYDLSYETPQAGFKGILSSDIKPEDIRPLIGQSTPLCYISSVSYGRAFYLVYQSSKSNYQLLSALATYFNRLKEGKELSASDPALDREVMVIQQGAGSQGVAMSFMSPSQVASLINSGLRSIGRDSGAPISFQAKYLYDDAPVYLSNVQSFYYHREWPIPRIRENRLTLHLRDITLRAEPTEGRMISSKAYAKLLGASLTFESSTSASRPVTRDFFEKMRNPRSQESLRVTARFAPNQIITEKCGAKAENTLDRATLKIQIEVRPETYRDGVHSGATPQVITLIRRLVYDRRDDSWTVDTSAGQASGTESSGINAARFIQTSHTLEGLRLDIRVNYTFFHDNTLHI